MVVPNSCTESTQCIIWKLKFWSFGFILSFNDNEILSKTKGFETSSVQQKRKTNSLFQNKSDRFFSVSKLLSNLSNRSVQDFVTFKTIQT